jgi:hypothetical protein
MEGVREPLRTGTLLGVHNTCGSRVRFFSHGSSSACAWRIPKSAGILVRAAIWLGWCGARPGRSFLLLLATVARLAGPRSRHGFIQRSNPLMRAWRIAKSVSDS